MANQMFFILDQEFAQKAKHKESDRIAEIEETWMERMLLATRSLADACSYTHALDQEVVVTNDKRILWEYYIDGEWGGILGREEFERRKAEEEKELERRRQQSKES